MLQRSIGDVLADVGLQYFNHNGSKVWMNEGTASYGAWFTNDAAFIEREEVQ
jgi:hypothetical protein